jgi:AhpD family alkylhydroperoxidase
VTGVTGIAARAMRPLALAQIRYVTPTRPRAADGLTAQVYRQMEREFGVLPPPVVLHSPAPEAMAATWLMLRETLLAPGLVDRAVREAVAEAVSVANACPYCVSVHSATLHGLLGGRASTDERVRDAAAWATESVERFTATSVSRIPFTPDEAPEYAGVAVVFHYLNRMVNTLLEDAPMPPSAPRAGLGLVQHVLSSMIRSASRRIGPAGASLDLLPQAPVPEDLGWARRNLAITQAFARAADAIDRASSQSVPQSVRGLLQRELAVWDGRARGLSRVWVERPLAALPAYDRPAGRLALLVAFASHQVDATVVEAYRADRPDDADLVALASWAALSAARRAGSWLPMTAAQERQYGR